MKQLVDFFETILFAAVTYPATIFYALVAPRKIFVGDTCTMICPPSLAIVISLYLFWFAKRILDEVLYRGVINKIGFASDVTLTKTLIVVAILIMLVRIILRELFKLNLATGDPVEELRILSYPVSVGLFVEALVTIIAINFPDAILWMAPHLDKEAAPILSDEALNIRFCLSLGTVTFMPVVFFSAWALFNVIRVGFNATRLRSLTATVTSIIVASVLLFLSAYTINHTTDMLERLSGKLSTSQEGTCK